MADVQPFRGLRFTATAAPDIGQVLCPPYDVIDATDDARLRERHPLNVVRLELTTASVAGGAESRYQEAAATLRSWRQSGALVREDAHAYYLHEATFTVPGPGRRQATRRELIAAVRVEPWEARAVLPHERTYPRAKADRLRLLAATETNLSPILSFFQRDGQEGNDAVDEAWAWTADRAADAAGTDSDGVGHRLWVLTDTALVGGLRAFFADRPLFIADGHHRYETALNYLEDRRQQAGGDLPSDHPARFVMMHLIAEDDPGLVILPLHRLVSCVGAADGFGSIEFWQLVERLEADFDVDISSYGIGPEQEVAEVIDGLRARGAQGQALALFPPEDSQVVVLTLAADAPLPAAIPSDRDRSWQTLDVVLLDYTVVRPLLAAHNLHAEDAIAYTRDAEDAIRQVRSGAYDLAVLVNPTRPEQLAAVALAGERMPEKSTYFYPKAPTGLVFRPLE